MADTLQAGGVSLIVKPDTTGFAGELKSKILGGVSGVGEGMGGMILGGLKSMAGPIAAVAAGFGIKSIIDDSIHSFENLAGGVKGMQRVLGGTTEEVSGMRAAMQLAGVPVDNLQSTMARFAKNLAEADTKGSKIGDTFAYMGIKATDAHGKLRTVNDLLPELADKFKDMPNGPEKTADAIAIFGRQGAAMLPFLNKGSEGIAELTAKAKEMGLTLDDAAMDKFAESKKATREFNLEMDGLKVTLGQAFLPVLEAVQNAFREFFIPLIEKATHFVKDHQKQFDDLAETIKSIVTPVVNTLLEGIKNLTSWVIQNKDVIIALGVAVGAGVIAFQGYQLVMGAITLAQKAWLVIQGIQKVVTGEATLAQLGLNSALIANPIGLVIAAIAALVAGLVWFFTQTKVGQEAWKNFTQFLSTAWSGFTKWITDVWTSTSKWLSDAFTNIGKFFSDTWNNMGKFLKTALDFIVNLIVNWSLPGIIAKVVGLVVSHWGEVTKFFSNSAKTIIDLFANAGTWLLDAGKNIIEGLINGATAMGSAVTRWITGLGNSIINGFKSLFGIHSPSTVFHDFGQNIGQGLANGLNASVDMVTDAMGNLSDATGLDVPGITVGASTVNGGARVATAVASLVGGSAGGQVGGRSTTIVYNAAPNDSITAEQKLIDAVQRAKVLGAI